MEKKKPHYPLELIKRLIADEGRDPFTQSAKNGAAEMGLEAGELRGIVADLSTSDFYKSMTTHANHLVWQDVYRPVTRRGAAYVKVTVYPLELVKRLVADKGRDPFTQSAKNGAAEMGLNADELRDVVAGLTAQDFYKSMTTHASHTAWQDVYRPVTRLGAAYVKVTVYPEENLIVVSFKGL